jgi:hypothetical protein
MIQQAAVRLSTYLPASQCLSKNTRTCLSTYPSANATTFAKTREKNTSLGIQARIYPALCETDLSSSCWLWWLVSLDAVVARLYLPPAPRPVLDEGAKKGAEGAGFENASAQDGDRWQTRARRTPWTALRPRLPSFWPGLPGKLNVLANKAGTQKGREIIIRWSSKSIPRGTH